MSETLLEELQKFAGGIKQGEILIVGHCRSTGKSTFNRRMLEMMRDELAQRQEVVVAVDESDGRVPMGILASSVMSEISLAMAKQLAELAVGYIEEPKQITYGPPKIGKGGKVKRW